MIVGSFAKTPAEIKSFSIEWEDSLDEGDTLADHAVTVPAGITLVGSLISGTAVKVTLSGGTAGTTYLVEVEVTTGDDLVLESEVQVHVTPVLVVGENTYGSVADADEYHAIRGNTGWLGADIGARMAALVKATAYIDARYVGKWLGEPTDPDQLLAWPRRRVRIGRRRVGSDEIPREVEAATFEAALREVEEAGTLGPIVTRDDYVVREKVGPIETEYAPNRISRAVIPAIDDAIGELVTSRGGVHWLQRA